MTKLAPWNLPPGNFGTVVREIKAKEDCIELSVTVLNGPHAGQEIKTCSPIRSEPPKRR